MWLEGNVMYSVCIYTILVLWACHGWVSKKKKKLDRGVGGLVELYPIFFGFFEFF